MRIALFPRKPDHVAGSAAPAIMVGCFVACGGILFGYDTGCISGILAMSGFRRQFSTGYIDPADGKLGVSPAQTAVIVSILSVGTFLGSLIAAPMGDYWGRRWSLIYSVAIFTAGVVVQTAAMQIEALVAGRFVSGLGLGIMSVLVPLYQSEMAPRWIRGTLVSAYQLAITFGLLVAAIVNSLTVKLDSLASFRIPLSLQFTCAGILFLGLLVLPETPRYLIKRELHAKAASSLSRLRRLDITHPALIEELAEIKANHAYELSLGPSTYRDVFFGSPHLGRRLLTGAGLQMFQQLTGCNFIFYYGTTYFESSGIESPFIISLITTLVNFGSTLPAIVLVESWGRRKLLLVGALGMTVCHLVVASVGTAYPERQSADVGIIVFVCLFIMFFAASWGPLVWVVTSEIFPLKVRAKSMSITTASNWLLNWAIAFGTPYLVNSGPGYADFEAKIFFVWAVCCFLAYVLVWVLVFETSKLTLEQIDEMYERVDKAWKSSNFQPTWSFQNLNEDNEAASTAIQLPTTNEARPRSTSSQPQSDGGESGVTNSLTAVGSAQTEEDKIVAELGHIDFSY